MTQHLIDPADYTPEIRACVARLKYRMDATLTGYEAGDVRAFQVGDEVYVLANPVLGEEPIYDEYGRVRETAPRHNITLIYPQGRLRILRPELCMKIVGGEVVDGGDPVPEGGLAEYFNQEPGVFYDILSDGP